MRTLIVAIGAMLAVLAINAPTAMADKRSCGGDKQVHVEHANGFSKAMDKFKSKIPNRRAWHVHSRPNNIWKFHYC